MLDKASKITSCYIGPEISPEQFVPEHFFLHLLKGSMQGYDGSRYYSLNAGESCIVRKNHLARYNKQKENGQFEKVVVVLDEAFLKNMQAKHRLQHAASLPDGAFLALKRTGLIPHFINSLAPYYTKSGKIEEPFADLKREELLLILLKTNPGLENILFDFGIPEKIDMKAFMNRNYKFNAGLERFAYLTGRSLSSFKRDFEKTFGTTPSHWLVQKRLQEAYFLIDKKHKKPTEVYLELGFEDLSHFSFAFKKQFGAAPTELLKQERPAVKKTTKRNRQ